jgi:DNA-3-methyladenine glycosylase I
LIIAPYAMASYCEYARNHPTHMMFHDQEHGFPVREENLLFERLALEINQAGLSWAVILKKRQSLNIAYDGFVVDEVAAYTLDDRERLLSDAGIIRNKLKVNALIHNANVIQSMRKSHGGFARWLDEHHPLGLSEWIKLFKKTFKFTGGEITNEFLMGIGYLSGAHDKDCPVFTIVESHNPPWL